MLDKDLEFLNRATNEQLKTLVDILVFDKEGKKRLTETLSSTQKFSECYPDNLKPLIPSIVNEIQLFGGNTLVNIFRGHGVCYREILEDVCDRLKVNYNKKVSVELLESELLRKVAVTVIEKMTDEDIKKFDENLDKTRLLNAAIDGNGAAIMATIAVIVSQFGQQVGKGALLLFGRALAPRVMAYAVPVLQIAAVVWTPFDIASPAYRVTIPFTITTAFMRRQIEVASEDELNGLFS
ncbi:MAG: DUF3944 domain-containing protein [Duncaniella sp.]|nr:DUF3944 domain-containing protein [Duncaniella sp.]